MDEPGKTTDQELVELRARVAQLEAELRLRDAESRRSTRGGRTRTDERARRELTDALRDASERSMDETQRLARGLTLAVAEQLQLTANVVAGFAEDIERRNTARDRDSLRTLPADVSSSLAAAIERSLDIPERVVDRFHSTYRDTDADRREERREERRERAERVERTEPPVEPL